MRWPRYSIVELMAIVVLAALDCLAIRSVWNSRDVFAVGAIILSIPMANILVVSLALVLSRKRGQAPFPPFLFGFEATGWTTLLALIAACWLTAPTTGSLAQTIQENPVAHAGHFVFVTLIFTTPQVLVAVIAGLITRRYRIRISIERRRLIVPETARSAPGIATI